MKPRLTSAATSGNIRWYERTPLTRMSKEESPFCSNFHRPKRCLVSAYPLGFFDQVFHPYEDERNVQNPKRGRYYICWGFLYLKKRSKQLASETLMTKIEQLKNPVRSTFSSPYSLPWHSHSLNTFCKRTNRSMPKLPHNCCLTFCSMARKKR